MINFQRKPFFPLSPGVISNPGKTARILHLSRYLCSFIRGSKDTKRRCLYTYIYELVVKLPTRYKISRLGANFLPGYKILALVKKLST
jgi:hypothetical protein